MCVSECVCVCVCVFVFVFVFVFACVCVCGQRCTSRDVEAAGHPWPAPNVNSEFGRDVWLEAQQIPSSPSQHFRGHSRVFFGGV